MTEHLYGRAVTCSPFAFFVQAPFAVFPVTNVDPQYGQCGLYVIGLPHLHNSIEPSSPAFCLQLCASGIILPPHERERERERELRHLNTTLATPLFVYLTPWACQLRVSLESPYELCDQSICDNASGASPAAGGRSRSLLWERERAYLLGQILAQL